MDEMPEYNKRKPLFTVMIGTGCRIGELVGLRWEDIDMYNRTIDINHSLFYFADRKNKTETKWVINMPKTESGVRVIPMADTVYAAFIEEKARQEEEGTFCARLCEADVNIKVIQSIMGHKDIQTTMDIYAEVTGDKKKKSLEQVFNQMKLFSFKIE